MIGLWGCGKTPPSEPAPKLEQSSENVQPSAQSMIIEKLSNYYEDLSRGQIEAANYYAPSVERFFTSQNISRDQIAKSLQNSIAQSPNRKLKLIPSSVKTIQSGENHIAEIAGIATKTDPSGALISKDTFRNRISFNQNMEIIAYESISAPAQTRKLGARYAEKEELIADLLQACRQKSLTGIQNLLLPNLGLALITREGVLNEVNLLQSEDMNLLFEGRLQSRWQGISQNPQAASIPNFACDNGFEQQGVFYTPLQEQFAELTYLMDLQNQSDKRHDQAKSTQAKKIEQLVAWQVVDTKTETAFFIGEKDGRWYLLVIDLALYNCSA